MVTGLELGWDCVVGVYDAETTNFEELCREYRFNPDTGDSDGYIIHDQYIKTAANQ